MRPLERFLNCHVNCHVSVNINVSPVQRTSNYDTRRISTTALLDKFSDTVIYNDAVGHKPR